MEALRQEEEGNNKVPGVSFLDVFDPSREKAETNEFVRTGGSSFPLLFLSLLNSDGTNRGLLGWLTRRARPTIASQDRLPQSDVFPSWQWRG